ncbi:MULTISPECIES: hypothetical protein [Streptomyces]
MPRTTRRPGGPLRVRSFAPGHPGRLPGGLQAARSGDGPGEFRR